MWIAFASLPLRKNNHRRYFWTSLYYTYITKGSLYKTLLCVCVKFSDSPSRELRELREVNTYVSHPLFDRKMLILLLRLSYETKTTFVEIRGRNASPGREKRRTFLFYGYIKFSLLKIARENARIAPIRREKLGTSTETYSIRV